VQLNACLYSSTFTIQHRLGVVTHRVYAVALTYTMIYFWRRLNVTQKSRTRLGSAIARPLSMHSYGAIAIPIPNHIANSIPNFRGLAIAAPSYGGPSPSHSAIHGPHWKHAQAGLENGFALLVFLRSVGAAIVS